MNNYRIYVEKYPEFQVEARSLLSELNENLQLDLETLRLLNVYDLFGFSAELLEKSRSCKDKASRLHYGMMLHMLDKAME